MQNNIWQYKLRKIFQWIFSLYVIVMFLLLMLLVFPFILACALLNKKYAFTGIYFILRTWAVVWYGFIFIRHKTICRDGYDKRQQYIYVANHASYLDIPQLLLATRRPVKVLGRHDMAKVPVFGIIYRSATILVDRSSIKKRIESLNKMKAELNKGDSLFIFPEGSFNESDAVLKPFIDGAFKLSIDSGKAILPMVFPDTFKRLNSKSLFGFTMGISRSVILQPVQPSDTMSIDQLKQQVFERMKEALLYYREA